MASNNNNINNNNDTDTELDPSPSNFKVTVQELVELIEDENVKALNEKYKQVEGLASALCSDATNGISTTNRDDIGNGNDSGVVVSLEARKQFYGENRLPARKFKSFWELCWEALQDITLIILLVCGIISLVFGLTIDENKVWCVCVMCDCDIVLVFLFVCLVLGISFFYYIFLQ